MKIIIGIKNGVAFPIAIPEGVTVEFRDYDNPGDATAMDDNGDYQAGLVNGPYTTTHTNA
jgi:hypothetical protein